MSVDNRVWTPFFCSLEVDSTPVDHNSTCDGQNSTPEGQNSTLKGQDSTPEGGQDSTSPEDQDSTAEGQDSIPDGQDSTPKSQDSTAEGQDSIPDGQDSTPKSQDSIPDGQDSTPKSQDSTAEGQDSIPDGQDSTPKSQDSTAEGQDSIPDGQDSTPKSQDSTAEGQDSTPKGQDSTPEGQDSTSPEDQDSTPNGQDSIPNGKESSQCTDEKSIAAAHNESINEQLQQQVCVFFMVIPNLPVSFRVSVRGNSGTDWHTHQFSQSGQSRSRSWPMTQCPIVRTWESAPLQWAVIANVNDKSPTFETVWEDLVSVFAFLMWDKNKNPFWMGTLTLILTWLVELGTHKAVRPSGLHSANWPREDQCQRSHEHGFLSYNRIEVKHF